MATQKSRRARPQTGRDSAAPPRRQEVRAKPSSPQHIVRQRRHQVVPLGRASAYVAMGHTISRR